MFTTTAGFDCEPLPNGVVPGDDDGDGTDRVTPADDTAIFDVAGGDCCIQSYGRCGKKLRAKVLWSQFRSLRTLASIPLYHGRHGACCETVL